MDDDALSHQLLLMGLDSTSVRVLPLLPLVQVAWADGAVQEAERVLLQRLASEHYELGEEGMRVLKNWLHHPPSARLTQRGSAVLLALCERGGTLSEDVLRDVVRFAREVAKAAGGFFGFGAIDANEAQAIAEIAAALQISSDRSWSSPDDVTMVPADADLQSDGPAVDITFATASPTTASRGTLIRYDPDRGDRSCAVTEAGILIGRSREATVQIAFDAQVSREHCRLFRRSERFYVQDCESLSGTWVNGERIVERRLFGDESIQVGSARFYFQLSPSAP